MLRVLLAAAGGLPFLFLSAGLLAVWLNPMSIDQGGWLKLASTLVLFEFLLLHSGVFMATGPIVCKTFWTRLAWFAGFSLVYGIGVVGFAIWSGGEYVLWLLLAVLLSRLMTLVILRDKKGILMMLQRSALGMTLLLLTALICLLPVPPLGITEEIRYATFGASVDSLSEYPQKTLAWGMMYFFLMALVEFIVGWNLPDWTDEQAEKGWKTLSN